MNVEMTELPPRYVVNPALSTLAWTPEPWQVIIFYNPSWFNSLWLGTAWNLFVFPSRLWSEVIKTALSGRFERAPFMLFYLLSSTCLWMLAGVLGRLRGIHVPFEVRFNSHIMNHTQAGEALKAGNSAFVIDMNAAE